MHSTCRGLSRFMLQDSVRKFSTVDLILKNRNTSLPCENPTSMINTPAVRGFKIYTKTGDKGTSSLFTGERKVKSHEVFHALGDVDELNSNIGLAVEVLKESWQIENFKDIIDFLKKSQCILLDVGSCVATPLSSAKEHQVKRVEFDGQLIDELEQLIDVYTADLPPLRNFILPGGGKSSSRLHICRSVCRRAERSMAPLLAADEIDEAVYRYVNRLSDYFFVAARFTASMEGHEENIYKKQKRKTDVTEDAHDPE